MKHRLSPARLWPPAYLRYLLIWPAVKGFRRKTRTRLAWRLAASHFGMILWSIFAICVLLLGISAIVVTRALPNAGEASIEAEEIATVLGGVERKTTLDNTETNALLKALVTGELRYNYVQGNTWIEATIGPQLSHIESISIIGLDTVVVNSSDPALIGQPASRIDPVADRFVARALTGSLDLGHLAGDRQTGPGTIGVVPLFDDAGQILGVVTVAKSQSSLPSSVSGLFLLGFSFVGQVGVILLFLVGVPAIPIGIVLGIRRARAISRPISDLAIAAQNFAEGDHASRVLSLSGEDEVGNLQRGFNAMADELALSMQTETAQRTVAESALEANRELIANVSHELRTPVALIRGHLEALESDPLERDAYLRIALRETDRLERLVEELFELSRLESHQLRLDLAPFDAGAAARSAVESLREPARREAGLTLTTAVDDGNLTCFGDRLRFEQVLLNLIRNAVRYTPEGGIVLVSVNGDAAGVTVTIRDTGAGIPARDVEHIFDRFYRSDQSRARASGGAGLGLAIAKELVVAMGATISVESTVDEGTAFTIVLPRRATNGHRGPAAPARLALESA